LHSHRVHCNISTGISPCIGDHRGHNASCQPQKRAEALLHSQEPTSKFDKWIIAARQDRYRVRSRPHFRRAQRLHKYRLHRIANAILCCAASERRITWTCKGVWSRVCKLSRLLDRAARDAEKFIAATHSTNQYGHLSGCAKFGLGINRKTHACAPIYLTRSFCYTYDL